MESDHTALNDYFASGEVEAFSEESLTDVLFAAGLKKGLARAVARDALAWFDDRQDPRTTEDVQLCTNRAIAALQTTLPLRVLAQQRLRNPVPAPTPVGRGTVVAPHGTVRRGRKGRNGAGRAGDRPHVFLWFERDPKAPCREYEWYQFVRPSFWLNGRETLKGESFTSSIGGAQRLGEWSPDFHKDYNEQTDKSRKKGGLKPTPSFSPPGLKAKPGKKIKAGKPYAPRIIPGTKGRLGLEDAPDFCRRDVSGRKPSQLERWWRKKRRRKVTQRRKPPGATDTAEVRMMFRSYLVCLSTGKCLGYVAWTYRIASQIQYDWKKVAGVTGNLDPTWTTYIVQTRCTYHLEVGDWTPC